MWIKKIQTGFSSWTASPFGIGPRGCPETSVTAYQSALRNIPEARKTSQDVVSFIARGEVW